MSHVNALRDSLLWHVSTLTSFSLHLSIRSDFHVQYLIVA
jgi:hypothetical protein